MDRKAILIIAISVGLLLLWPKLVDKMLPPPPKPPGGVTIGATNAAPKDQNRTLPDRNATGGNQSAIGPAVPPVGPVAPVIVVAGGFQPVPTRAGKTITQTATNALAEYVFTSRGGGIQEVRLNLHKVATACWSDSNTSNGDPRVRLNGDAPYPIFAVQGGDGLLKLTGLEEYELSPLAAQGNATAGWQAVLTLANDSNETVQIIKSIRPGTGYLLPQVTIEVLYTGSRAVVIPDFEVLLGAATPAGVKNFDPAYHGIFFFDGKLEQHWKPGDFANRTLGCFPGTPIPVFSLANRDSNSTWVAAHNQFYAVATMLPDGGTPREKVSAKWIDSASLDESLKSQNRYQAGISYNIVLEPGKAWRVAYDVYAGPREYSVMEKLAAERGNQVERVMDLSGFWGFFSKVLLLSMNGLHSWGVPYGLAIVLITVIIKALFWPLTAVSTRSMKRMALLQPQMKALQEKYKSDSKKMNMKLMEFMKENKVNPLGGCLPMLIQIPVFFGFFFMIRTAVELRGAPFLWACDLSSPDTIFTIPGITFLPFFSNAMGLPINPLPILMAVTMWYQARLTPPSPGVDPMQAKMMQYMPLVFSVFLYNFSAGLTLYWTVQNVLSIAQTKMTKTELAPA